MAESAGLLRIDARMRVLRKVQGPALLECDFTLFGRTRIRDLHRACFELQPCSLSLTHQPSATTHSPAVTDGSAPITVASPRCPGVFIRSTQKAAFVVVNRGLRPTKSHENRGTPA
jgi:hypothetical protein